ncbi:DNA-directed DNA polymerase [Tanacetum coccineum]|uniref:DNA-directed DNA polymerase n=1 Tax=Tanacetum coccineum TaxID=301880 RepID=A0ABQ5HR07_9ASTR
MPRKTTKDHHNTKSYIPKISNEYTLPLKRNFEFFENHCIHEGRVVYLDFDDLVYVRSMFGHIGFECLLDINEQIVPRFIPEFYSQYRVNYTLEGQMLIEFVIQDQFFSYTLKEFGQILSIPFRGTIFKVPPYPFNYPTRRLNMEETLAKFIDEGKREHKEMEIFIKEFRTTNELLLKEQSNLLSELKIKEKPHDVGMKNKSSSIPERTTQPLVKPQSSFPFLNQSLLANKPRLEEACTVTMNERCSTVLLNKLPSKEKDPGSFTIPCQVLEKHKEAEDLAIDHLSRLENPHMEVLTERKIVDKFSNEHLMVLKFKFNNDESWYADFVNYIVRKYSVSHTDADVDNFKRCCTFYTIPFIEALVQMPKYTKYLKSLLANKPRLEEACTVTMNERCSTVLLNKLPSKEKDPGSFTIPCQVSHLQINNALADLGASISLMPYMMYEKLGLGEPKPTRMSFKLADSSIQYPRGIVKNVLINVDKFVLPIDFVILDMPEDSRIMIILERPFLATARAMIDDFYKKITLRVGDDEVIFNMDHSIKKPPTKDDECHGINDTINIETQELLENDQLDLFLLKGLEKSINQPGLESCNSIGDEFANNSDVDLSIRHIDPVNTLYSDAQETEGTDRVKNKHLYSASTNEIDEKNLS